MGKPIFALTLEEARAELLRAAPRTWRQDMLRVRIEQLKRKESNGDAAGEVQPKKRPQGGGLDTRAGSGEAGYWVAALQED